MDLLLKLAPEIVESLRVSQGWEIATPELVAAFAHRTMMEKAQSLVLLRGDQQTEAAVAEIRAACAARVAAIAAGIEVSPAQA